MKKSRVPRDLDHRLSQALAGLSGLERVPVVVKDAMSWSFWEPPCHRTLTLRARDSQV